MTGASRLNGVIRAWESGKPAFASFASADRTTAIAFSTSPYDGIVFEMEHNPWDPSALQDALQYLLNRAQIAKSGSVAPAVTPLVRCKPQTSAMGATTAPRTVTVSSLGVSRARSGASPSARPGARKTSTDPA